MSNQPNDSNFFFDEELFLDTGFTGVPQLLGTLNNKPVILLVKNYTDSEIFVADQQNDTHGTTMQEGECFVLDCRANKGDAVNGSFPQGTSFFVTVPAIATGSIRIAIIYAK